MQDEAGEIIFFNGTNSKGKVHYLVFGVRDPINNKYKTIEIPVPKIIADLVMTHLHKHAPPPPKPVERGNDEESL